MHKTTLRTAAAAIVVLLGASSTIDGERGPDAAPGAALFGTGIDFVENRGQWDTPARFVAPMRGGVSALLRPGAITLRRSGARPSDVSLVFDGASPSATLAGEQRRAGVYNFFVGNDRARWRSNVPAFGAVRYGGLYDGIDLRVLQRDGRLEYDLLVAPNADVNRVVVRVDGARAIDVDGQGRLVLETADGVLRQTAPVTWETLPDGTARRLESRFRRLAADRYGFEVPGRSRDLPLVIDPGLEWSTFIGGSNREEVHGLARTTDGTGDLVITGHTFSADFGPAGVRGASPLIPFVARLDGSGSALVYATFFGSTNGNVSYAFDLALDASSAPIVVGETNGADFPTTPGAFQPAFNEPSGNINRGWDGFVTRFDATGSRMVFSTFLGAAPIVDPNHVGSKRGGDDSARNVVMDGDSVIVAGYTMSENFPVTAGAYDTTHAELTVPVQINGVPGTIRSRTDAFITRLDPTGSRVTYSTYLGAESDDIIKGMVIDPLGVVTVVGVEAPLETFDSQGNRTDHGVPFPTTPDAIARTHLGASDTFLARLSLDGNGTADLKYSTILGGFYIDEATDLALDPNNPELVTIVGNNRSWDFPTTRGAWRRAPQFLTNGDPYYSGFMMRFRFPAAGGGSLVWSSLITGTQTGQFAEAVVIDGSGDVIVVGQDIAGTYPTTERSYKRLPTKGSFVSRFSSDGSTVLYSTLLHKPSGALVLRMRAVSAGPRAVVVAGSTLHPDHPTTAGAYDRVFGTNGTGDGFHTYDGFVARLSLEPNTSADTSAAAPALVSPANGATVPINGPLTLDWSDVADPSGVQLYEVQIAANADFLSGFTFFNTAAGTFTVSQAVASTQEEGIHYWRVRTLDGANNFSPWSPVRRFIVGNPAWTNFAAMGLSPEAVVGGGTITGTVHIMNTAPPGGQVYTLSSSNPSVASVPPSVTIPAGASSATFTVTTRTVSRSTPVQLLVWSEGNGDQPVLWVDPGTAPPPAVVLSSLALSPSTVAGGTASTGTVTLSGAAPAGGVAVSLSDDSSAVTTPASVLVAQGATSATFTAATTSVAATTLVTVTASAGAISRTADLTVTATGGGGGAPGFFAPGSNQADTGGDGNGFQTGASNAHAEDGAVATDTNSGTGTSTSCTNTGKDRHRFADFGLSVPAGASVAGIEVRLRARADSTSGAPRMCVQLSWDGGATWTAAKATATLTTALATATLGGAADTWGRTWTAANLSNTSFRLRVINVSSSTTRDFFLDAVAVRPHVSVSGPAALNALTMSPSSVVGGSSVTGTVTLTAAAPAGGAQVSLASSEGAVLSTPASVTVAAGATGATFTASTSATATNTPVTVTATYAGINRTAAVTVTPAPAPATLQGVGVTPASVTGGASSQGTVTLSSAAPAGGAVVSLTSSHSAVTVPLSVTVPAGAASATFTASTTNVSPSTAVTITATYNGTSRTATLTVNPAPAAMLQLLSVSPGNVVGGATAQGGVQLTTFAPAGGAVIALSSNNPAVSVPATVTVPAGDVLASFVVTTTSVTTSTFVTVTGTYAGGSRSATLMVNPPSQNATLTVSVTGRSGERVTSSPAGINVAVGSSGSASFTAGTSITLSVSNGRDAIFSGACSSGGAKQRSCTFTLHGNASVTANVQ